MDDRQVNRAIANIEQGLAQDDPTFVRRCRTIYRSEMATVITVFVLLAAGAVLLTVGAATTSWGLWVAGVVAFLASYGVDEHPKHWMRSR
jgi:hypothetical protein